LGFSHEFAILHAGLPGNVYHASTTPVGLAIPIYTSVTPIVCLWNPIGSGKNASILNILVAYTSGTATYGAFGLSYVTNTGSAIGTGAVFSAFGSNTMVNGIVGGGAATVMRVATAGTTTLSTAPTAANWFYTLGNFNLEAATGTAHATYMPGSGANPQGAIIVPPGTAIWLCATLGFGRTLCSHFNLGRDTYLMLIQQGGNNGRN